MIQAAADSAHPKGALASLLLSHGSMARRRAFAYSADIRQIPPELGLTNCRYKSLLNKNWLITYQIRMIHVAAKMAVMVHKADVPTFVKSMMYIQGAYLFPGRQGHHP